MKQAVKQTFLLLSFILLTFSQARMLDGIAIVVEGQPITTAEIRAVRSQAGISKAKAIDLLIQDRLQKSAMKDITVTEEEVDAKIEEIAKQNHITLKKMQQILKRQGTSWVQYRNSIAEALKKARFYQDVVVASIPDPTEDELKFFYRKHQKQFTIPRSITMTEYTAPSEKELNTFIRTHKRKGTHIQSKTLRKATDQLSPEILSLLLQTPKNRYTPVMNTGDTFITYKVRAANGKRIMPFEMAKNAVEAAWKKAQQDTVLKDYFQKLRTRADIQILR